MIALVIALCLVPVFLLAWTQWPRTLEPFDPFLEATTLEPLEPLDPTLEALDWDHDPLEGLE